MLESDYKIGSRVSVHGHDTHTCALGVIYHLEQDGLFTIASICLDWGVDVVELPLDSILIHDSIPECNPAWDDIFNKETTE